MNICQKYSINLDICQVTLVAFGYNFCMGREKLKRNLQFKPVCKVFEPKSCKSDDVIHLLHEEMEALYLMDALGMYQAKAAEQMGISRPTFARIIKSAREKVTRMLVGGANLHIEDDKEEFTVLVASMNENVLLPGKPDAPFLLLYEINKFRILRSEVIENPVFVESKRPGEVLPELCNRYGVNFFVASKIGAGLKSALLSKGIFTLAREELQEEELTDIELFYR